jgi:hypothetical protein
MDEARRASFREKASQSNQRLELIAPFVDTTERILEAGAGMEPAGAERHGRSPQGELSGESESIEPALGIDRSVC